MSAKSIFPRPDSNNICPKCGKRQYLQREGSITSWIFSVAACKCEIVCDESADDDVPAPSTRQGAYETLRIKRTQMLGAPTTSSFAAPTPQSQLALSDKIKEKYDIVSRLGEGGMGDVYLVREKISGVMFALKLIKQEFVSDARAIQLFETEAAAIRKLVHPNLVSICDYDAPLHGIPYLLMEYVQGVSLSDLLAKNLQLEPSEVIQIFIQVCDAIQHAHNRGILHCDIKPSNIIIDEDKNNYVKVIDFGIAKLLNARQLLVRDASAPDLVGTPEYMSPEHCQSEPLDARCDIYSIGCVMHEALCGQPPFANQNPIKVIVDQVKTPARNLSKAYPELRIPGALAAVVSRCLKKRPDDRFQTAAELKETLQQLAQGKRPPVKLRPMRSPVFVILVSTAGSLIFCASVWFWLSRMKLNRPEQNAFQEAMQNIPNTDPLSYVDMKQICARKNMTSLSLVSARIRNSDLAPIASLQNLTDLNLSGTDVDDTLFQYIVQLPLLRNLDLGGTDITANGLHALRKMPQIVRLSLSGCDVVSAAMPDIQSLPQLRDLALSGSDFKDDDVPQLTPLKSLRQLSLDKCLITDAGVRLLASLPVTYLNLSHTKVSDAAMKALATSPVLADLDLTDTRITDQGVENLLGTRVVVLNLMDTEVTEKCASSLQQMKTLRELWVKSTVSDTPAFKKLAETLPNCTLDHSNPRLNQRNHEETTAPEPAGTGLR